MIRALIVDDEPLGRDGVRVRLAAQDDVEVVGEATDGLEAVDKILRLRPDLVFLDVQMPEIDGFEVLARVAGEHLPAVVFVSAYDRFAIKAFEIHALDYLLKPYSGPRFDEALRRVRHELGRAEREMPRRLAALLESRGRSPLARFVVHDRDRFLLLPAHEVEWIEAAGNYVEIHARGKSFLARHTMKDLEARLDARRFARIHRSVIVAIERVRQVVMGSGGDYEVTLEGGRVLPMSRTYRGALPDRG
jgi:two-component system, LytTR family, response regulator